MPRIFQTVVKRQAPVVQDPVFPSYVAPNSVHTPAQPVVTQAGISVVDGRVVLAGIVREFNHV